MKIIKFILIFFGMIDCLFGIIGLYRYEFNSIEHLNARLTGLYGIVYIASYQVILIWERLNDLEKK